jgi:hypothetical protein
MADVADEERAELAFVPGDRAGQQLVPQRSDPCSAYALAIGALVGS